MGFAEMLILLGIPYAAGRSFSLARELMQRIDDEARAACQEHCDNAVSKTVNLPRSATPGDVQAIYTRAWEWGLKGVTIFRYGSKGKQVLNLGTDESPENREHYARCDPGECKL